MKQLIFLLLGFFVWQGALSQTTVQTENAQTIYKRHSTATTGDTMVICRNASFVDGNSKQYFSTYLVGIVFGTPVASDTVIIKNGTDTLLNVINTSDVKPYFLPLGCKADTSIIYIQKKTSWTTLLFRKLSR